jgi:hypothetical protein
MRSVQAADDRGSVAAEFAVALPAVALVLAVCLGGIAAGAQSLRLQDGAAEAARALGRGETGATAADRAARAAPGSAMSSWSEGRLVCVHLESPAPGPIGALGLRLSAQSCTAAGPS